MATSKGKKGSGKKSSKGGGKKSGKAGGAKKSAGSASSKVNVVQEQPKSPMPAQHQAKPGIEAALNPRPEYQAPRYKGSGKLEGKAALITGGDSGIGRAVAVLYAREGADVAIVYLPAEQSDAEEARSAVEAEGRRCLLLPGDLTRPDFCRQAVERTVKEFGRLDVLVNNAAFQQRQSG